MLLSPAADVIAGHCIARVPWSPDLWRVLVACLFLFAAGLVLGQRRHRRSPAGSLAPGPALGLGLGLALVGVLVSPVPVYHGVMALLVFAYDYLLKHMRWLGAIGVGALRAVNLAAPAALSLGPGHFLPERTVLYAAGAYALYFVAVTLLRGMRHDTSDQRAIRRLVIAPLLAVLVGLMLAAQPWPAVGVAFFLAAIWCAHHRYEHWGQQQVTAASTSLLVGGMAFASLLCLTTDQPWEALAVALMLVTSLLLRVRIGIEYMDRRHELSEAGSKQAVPVPAAPAQVPPVQAAREETAPQQPVPKQQVPKQQVPKQSVPKQSVPEQTATTQVAPKQVAPRPAAAKRPDPKTKVAAKPLVPRNALVYLRLLRVGMLFSPAADVIAGHCIANVPWTGDLWRVLIASVCLYGAGMVLNDHADRRVDAQLRPERPLPAGQIGPDAVLGFGLLLMLASLLVSPVPIYHGAMAALVLAYDYKLKSITWLGALAMGLLRAMNLTAGAVLGLAVGPTDLVLYAASAYALYVIAVTLLGAMEDDTRNQKAIRGLLCVPPLVAFLALMAMSEPWPAVGIAFVLMGVLLAHHRHRQWGQDEVRAAMTWLLLGTMAYTSLLCLASGHGWEALIVALMVVPARLIAMTISLT